MKQILIQLEDSIAQELERVAPGKGRKRSEFLRSVIARALLEVREVGTRKAYSRWPDALPVFDPAEWAPEEDAVRPTQRRGRAEARRTPRRKASG